MEDECKGRTELRMPYAENKWSVHSGSNLLELRENGGSDEQDDEALMKLAAVAWWEWCHLDCQAWADLPLIAFQIKIMHFCKGLYSQFKWFKCILLTVLLCFKAVIDVGVSDSDFFLWLSKSCQSHVPDTGWTCSGCYGDSLLICVEGEMMGVCSSLRLLNSRASSLFIHTEISTSFFSIFSLLV